MTLEDEPTPSVSPGPAPQDESTSPPQRSFSLNVGGTFVAYVAGLAANLVVSILVARRLGPGGAGQIALALVGPNILALVGNLGLARSISHFLNRSDIPPARIVSLAMFTNIIVGVLLAAAYLFVGVPLLGLGLPDELNLVAAMIIPFEIALQDWMAVAQGLHRFGRRSAMLLSYRWLYAAGASAMVYFLGDTVRPGHIVGAGLLAYGLTFVIGMVLVGKLVPCNGGTCEAGPQPRVARLATLFAAGLLLASIYWPEHRSIIAALAAGAFLLYVALGLSRLRGEPLGQFRQLIGYAWRVHVAALVLFLLLRVDLYLVGWLLDSDSEVGLYSRATQIAEVIFYFLLAAENVLYPRMSALPAAEVPRAAMVLCRRGLLAGAALVVVLEAASRWLILIPFGEEFLPAVGPLRVLLPAVLAVGFAQMLFSVFNALERPWPPAVAALVGLGTMVGLDLWLIPQHGIVGAAWASLGAYSLTALVTLAWFLLTTRRSVPA